MIVHGTIARTLCACGAPFTCSVCLEKHRATCKAARARAAVDTSEPDDG